MDSFILADQLLLQLTIAISDPAYYLPSVSITPYQEDSFDNLTPHAEFTLDATWTILKSDTTTDLMQQIH